MSIQLFEKFKISVNFVCLQIDNHLITDKCKLIAVYISC